MLRSNLPVETLIFIVISSFLVSLGSLIGIFTLSLQAEKLSKILLFIVSLSAGALMGTAFIHLLPEAVEKFEAQSLFLIVLASFITFFFIEKLFYWRHCHHGKCDVHTFGYMNLLGDSVHNLIDGFLIAGAFLTDTGLGIVTVLAVALHEIPQEIGDFGVLLYAGFSRKKALILNFLVATMVIIGGAAGYFLSFASESLVPVLLPVAAGGFIYIAASDLMPEIRKEADFKKSMFSFGIFLIGVSLTLVLKLIGIE